MKKILSMIFMLSLVTNIYAQKTKNPINKQVTGAYIKTYLDLHPEVKSVFVFNNVEGQPIYTGLFYKFDGLFAPPEINSENYSSLKLIIKKNFLSQLNLKITNELTVKIGEEISLEDRRKSLINVLEENNSDLLIYVSIEREYIEKVPDDKSIKTLSIEDIKEYRHTLSIKSRIYFKHRLENKEIAFRHTFFSMGFGEEKEVESVGGISDVISTIEFAVSSLLGDDTRVYTVEDTTFVYPKINGYRIKRVYTVEDTTFVYTVEDTTFVYTAEDTTFNTGGEERWNKVDTILSNKAERDIKNKSSALIGKLSQDLKMNIQGVVTDESSYSQDETVVVKFVDPKYGEVKGTLNKLKNIGERISPMFMVALIEGDDKVTPFHVEKEHMRVIGRSRILADGRINGDYEGKVKVRKLSEGVNVENLRKVVIVSEENLEWVLNDTKLLPDVSESDIIDFTINGKKATDFIESQNIIFEEQKKLGFKRKKNEVLSTVTRLPLPSPAYLKEKNSLLFPNTVIDERTPLSKIPKKEKKSVIARINRMEETMLKIGVVFAIQESYVEAESKTTTQDGNPVIEKENWEPLSESFYPLGNRLVEQLNEKFDTDVFELINMYDFPMEKKDIQKIILSVNKIEQNESFHFPAFEKTQYPVVAFYAIQAFENLDGEKKLSSNITMAEFYGKGQSILLGTGGLLSVPTTQLGELTMTSNQKYEESTKELIDSENNAISDYFDSMKRYYDKKVK